MTGSLPLHPEPICVEVTERTLRVAQAARRGVLEEVTLPREPEEAGEDGWPGPAECVRLAAVLGRRRFRGRRLRLSVPHAAGVAAEVTGVVAAGEEAAALAAAAAAGPLGFEPARCELTSSRAPAGGVTLVRGCRSAPLLACVEALDRAGLRLEGACSRIDALAAVPAAGPRAWLDAAAGGEAGVRRTLVVTEGGRAASIRPLRGGVSNALRDRSPAAQRALAAELLPGLRQAASRCVADAIASLAAAGDEAGTPAGPLETLAERVGLGIAADAGGAAGVARAMAAGAGRGHDLLPRQTRTLRRETTRATRVLGAAAGYAAAAAVATGLFVAWGPGPADASVAARAEATAARAAIADAEAAAAAERVAGLADRAAAAAAAADRPDWRRVLNRLAADAAGGIRLTEIDLGPNASPPSDAAGTTVAVRLSGEAPDPGSAWAFALALERGGLFASVELSRTRRASTLPDAAIAFQVDALVEPLPAARGEARP